MEKYYFRCKSNPDAPLLTLTTEWEAREMRTNEEYDRVDEDGLPVVVEDEPVPEVDVSIPFHAGARKK